MKKNKNFIKHHNVYVNVDNLLKIELDEENCQVIFSYNKQEDFKKIILDFQKEETYFIHKKLTDWFSKSLYIKILETFQKIRKGK